jgi:uncharacterized LabA/DUF88 family protein
VISHYDEIHGKQAFRNDEASKPNPSAAVVAKLAAAHVNLEAIVEYAASFGDVSIARAYADWSVPVNANYRQDIAQRSIDTVQMFPLSGTKNGADIRLAIDVIEDLARYAYISHVVIVAGDSDYVSLAQRCKRLGRTVVGIGAAGSVGRYWRAACDVFKDYDQLPGLPSVPKKKAAAKAAAATGSTELLRRAMALEAEKSTDGWTTAGALKNLMLRLDPAFDEKAEGHRTFTAFLNAHSEFVETKLEGQVTSVRLRETPPRKRAAK